LDSHARANANAHSAAVQTQLRPTDGRNDDGQQLATGELASWQTGSIMAAIIAHLLAGRKGLSCYAVNQLASRQ